ncbi:MAG: MFS transporter [Rhodobiaceae bacterium]|mgnify:FL=1|jgi:MFS family permease|nr:MFS transporter [Rhodobiaceae bacterium]MDB4831627.1 MFS transporter [Hyphomicrobiales bacterium]MDC3272513.1 MFS transporter [Hyphomicrobiales bacterium]
MKQAYSIIIVFSLGYLLAIIFRSINTIIAPNLINDIGLTAASLGLLSSSLLIAHAAAQIPLGIYLDSHGPKKVQIALLSLAAIGCIAFALSNNIYVMTFARILMGVGFSGCLMAGFKAVSMYLKPNNYALGNGIIMGAGQIGILITSWPTEIILQYFSWRGAYALFIILIFVIIILTYLFIPNNSTTKTDETLKVQLSGLKKVFEDKALWHLAPLIWITGGAHIALLTLWTGPWLHDVAGLGREQVATSLTIIALSVISGIFLSGLIAKILTKYNVNILKILQYILIVNIFSLIPLFLINHKIAFYTWIIFAMTGQGGILSYPWITERFGLSLSSRANTVVNLGTFVVAFFIQYLIGVIIDLFPLTADGQYNPDAYKMSFFFIFTLQILILLWFFKGKKYLNLNK